MAILLALLMFATSVVIPMDMHYCRGELKTVAFFGKAKNCYGQVALEKHSQPHPAPPQAGPTLTRKKCCENKSIFVELEQDQEIGASGQLFIAQHYLLPPDLAVHPFVTNILSSEASFQRHIPPLQPRDIPIWVQSFRL